MSKAHKNDIAVYKGIFDSGIVFSASVGLGIPARIGVSGLEKSAGIAEHRDGLACLVIDDIHRNAAAVLAVAVVSNAAGRNRNTTTIITAAAASQSHCRHQSENETETGTLAQ